MPDDKIIIELGAEEMELLRRQAVSAGADSLNEYAKKLLFGLLRKQDKPSLASANDAVKKLRAELGRLHSELQEFVANTVATPSPEALVRQPEPGRRTTASQAPQPPVFAPNRLDDELEEMARKTFSTSPALKTVDQLPAEASEPPPEDEPVAVNPALLEEDALGDLLDKTLLERKEADTGKTAENTSATSDSGDDPPPPRPRISGISGNIPPKKRR